MPRKAQPLTALGIRKKIEALSNLNFPAFHPLKSLQNLTLR